MLFDLYCYSKLETEKFLSTKLNVWKRHKKDQTRCGKFWHYHLDIYLGRFNSISALIHFLYRKHNVTKILFQVPQFLHILQFFVCTLIGCSSQKMVGAKQNKPCCGLLYFNFFGQWFGHLCYLSCFFLLQCRCIHFLFHFDYIACEVYDILESEKFFTTEVYLQPPNDGPNSNKGSD